MNRMEINVREAERALVEKPVFATTAESFLILNEIKSLYKELPHPLRFSRILGEVLSRVSVPLEEYDLIAGRSVDRELTAEEEVMFSEFVKHPDYPYGRLFYSSGHCTYSWESVVEFGICGLRGAAMTTLENADNEEKKAFLRGLIETYDAISAFMLRYADEAERRGMSEMARNLRQGAVGVPDSFASALQLLWIITFINCAYVSQNPTLTVGRLDKILYPLYLADIEKGVRATSSGRAARRAKPSFLRAQPS